MKKILCITLLTIVALSTVAVAQFALQGYKDPAPNAILVLAPTVQRFTEVNATNVVLLDLLPTFSVGVRAALEPLLPITSWDTLKGLTYIPYSYERNAAGTMEWVAGAKPRLVMSEGRALLFWLLFDLTGDFTWFGEVSTNG